MFTFVDRSFFFSFVQLRVYIATLVGFLRQFLRLLFGDASTELCLDLTTERLCLVRQPEDPFSLFFESILSDFDFFSTETVFASVSSVALQTFAPAAGADEAR